MDLIIGVSDFFGHYDIDGVSYDFALGVVVASDFLVIKPEGLPGRSPGALKLELAPK